MKLIGKLLALAAFGLSLAGSAAADGLRLVFVSHGQASDPFWSVVKSGVDVAAEAMDVEVAYRAPDTFDVIAMGYIIDAAVASRPDGLVVSIPDPDALGDSIRAAVADGIPVVSTNSGSEHSEGLGALLHVGQNAFEAGLSGGEKMRAAGVRIGLCLNHEVGNVSLDRRCEGFRRGMNGASEVLAASSDPTATRNRVIAFLSRRADIDGIIALGPLGAEPTLAAVAELGREITIATFDLSPEILRAVGDGRLLFAIDQQQFLQGYLPVVFMSLYARYGLVPNGQVPTGPRFVTKDNAAKVIELSGQGIR